MSISPLAFCLSFLPFLFVSMAADNDCTYPCFLLDCGSSANTTTSYDGRLWRGDSPSDFSSSNPENASFQSTAHRQMPSVEQVPYMTARVFNSQFTYAFPVSAGLKFVRLYFYPMAYSGIHESDFFFSVTSGAYTLLSNFSASLAVAAVKPHVASIVKEFSIPIVENQTLNLTFSPSPGFYAFVNGIEICSMPNDLYNKGDDEPIPLVATNYMFHIDDYTALETVYRVNVGGASLGGVRDTGMFRTWEQDWSYIFGSASGDTPQGNESDVRYTPTTPAYTAPAAVYSSARSMGPVPSINSNYNLTWIFPVDPGFHYLVRLHFCENGEYITRINERVFYIFINNQTAQDMADVIAWSGGAGIPMYKDYVVYVTPDGSQGKQDLWLALHPNMNSKPHFYDAILNGLEIFKLNQSSGSLAGPNPKPAPITLPQLQPEYSSKRKRRLSVFVLMGSTLLFTIFVLPSLVYLFKLSKRGRLWFWECGEVKLISMRRDGLSLPKELCRHFSLSELREATNGFDPVLIIGHGGFGDVYKGYIDEGNSVVAIKRLKSKSKQGSHEFLTEIHLLSKLRHRHLVSLIGYCEEEGEMMLVYNYMHHGTLRHHLYGSDYDPLPWKQRLEICAGAARGLEYLHAGAQHPVIHRDIKSTNILLDQKWVAKVSDFGLSKMGPSDDGVITIVKGTFGYMDPEYYKRMNLTQKSDVYSFGVVLLEVICGRAAVDRSLEYEKMSLANWARLCREKDMVDEIIDPHVMGQIADGCLHLFLETAYGCLLDEGIQRPTMTEVVARLESALQLQHDSDVTTEVLTLVVN